MKMIMNYKNEHKYIVESWNAYTNHDYAYSGNVVHRPPPGLQLVDDCLPIHLQRVK